MARIMGFSSFGSTASKKSSKTFDVEAMFANARKTASDRNAANNAKLEEAGTKVMSEDRKPAAGEDSDSDDGFVGPAIPKDMGEPTPGTSKEAAKAPLEARVSEERSDFYSGHVQVFLGRVNSSSPDREGKEVEFTQP